MLDLCRFSGKLNIDSVDSKVYRTIVTGVIQMGRTPFFENVLSYLSLLVKFEI